MAKQRRRTIVLTVDSGPNRREPARFYRLVVAGEPDAVREDLLVPDGEELRATRRHDVDDAA